MHALISTIKKCIWYMLCTQVLHPEIERSLPVITARLHDSECWVLEHHLDDRNAVPITT